LRRRPCTSSRSKVGT